MPKQWRIAAYDPERIAADRAGIPAIGEATAEHNETAGPAKVAAS